MFVGYITNGTVAASSTFIFTQKFLTNNNISYDSTSGKITINTPGYYSIHSDITGTASAAGNITTVLTINGTASTYAKASTTPAAGSFTNPSFETVLKVSPAPSGTTIITLLNSGGALTSVSGNIVIERIA